MNQVEAWSVGIVAFVSSWLDVPPVYLFKALMHCASLINVALMSRSCRCTEYLELFECIYILKITTLVDHSLFS